ncbi:MAG: efflux RND transporter periplasmic adaptor subunit [Planctomycetaceae bacterium]
MTTGIDLRELAVDRTADHQPDGIGPKPRWVSRLVLPLALLAGFAAVIGWAAKDTLSPGRPVTVVPVFVTRSAAEREGTPLFKTAGWVEPRPTTIRVPALAPGVVERLLVVQDQEVKEGEPVAKLVTRAAELTRDIAAAELALQKAERDRAEATLAAAKSRLDNPAHLTAAVAEAEAVLAQVETQLATLPGRIQEAEARRTYAAERLGRVEQLRGGAASGDTISKARSEAASVEAELARMAQEKPALERERDALTRKVAAARTLLELKTDEKRAVGEAEAALAAAEATVRRAELALADAELQLGRMNVRAPVSGRVLELIAEPGSRVGADKLGQDGSTVVTMYRPESLQLRVDVRFEDLPKIVVGQPAIIESPAVAEPLTGTVLYLTSRADIQKNTLAVKVALDDPPGVLKPEMLADVTFLAPASEVKQTPSERQRTYVPKRLVQAGESGSFIWVADVANGLARRQLVETGREVKGGLIEVTGGLTAASRLIASGREGLEDGDRIRIVGEDAQLGIDANPASEGEAN